MRSRSAEQPPDLPFNPPSARQQEFLARNGLADHRLDFFAAMHAIGSYVCSRRQLVPTERQIRFLKRHNEWHEGMNRGQAHDKIEEIVTKSGIP